MKTLLRLTLLLVLFFLTLNIGAQRTALPMGKIDKSFGTDGSMFGPTGFGVSYFGDAISLPGGKMAFANTYADPILPNRPRRIEVARALPNGEPDPTFGNQGIALFSFGSNDYAVSLAPAPDGKIIVVGSTSGNPFSSTYGGNLLVFRVMENGQLDTTFGTDGAYIKDFCGPNSTDSCDSPGGGALVLSDGHIMIGVKINRFPAEQRIANVSSVLMRLDGNGALDTSYGKGGFSEQLELGIENSVLMPRIPMVEQADGKLLVGLNSEVSSTDFQIQGRLDRYLDNGLRDTTFADNGQLVINFPSANITSCGTIKVLPKGDVLFLLPFAVAKIKPSGVYDESFGSAGIKNMIAPADLLVQGDGKIIVSGADWTSNRQIVKVQRLFQNGMTDLRFGTAQNKTQVTWIGGFGSNNQMGAGRIHPIDSQHVYLSSGYNIGSDQGRVLLTKIITSK